MLTATRPCHACSSYTSPSVPTAGSHSTVLPGALPWRPPSVALPGDAVCAYRFHPPRERQPRARRAARVRCSAAEVWPLSSWLAAACNVSTHRGRCSPLPSGSPNPRSYRMLAGPSVPHHTSFQEVMESTHSPYHVACLPPRPQRSQHSSRLLWRGHAVGACASCGPVRRSPTSRSVEQLRAHPPHIRVIMLHISRYVRSSIAPTVVHPVRPLSSAHVWSSAPLSAPPTTHRSAATQ